MVGDGRVTGEREQGERMAARGGSGAGRGDGGDRERHGDGDWREGCSDRERRDDRDSRERRDDCDSRDSRERHDGREGCDNRDGRGHRGGDPVAGVAKQMRPLVLLPLVGCVAIAVPDLFLDRVPPLVILLLIGPLLTCVRLDVRHTVLVCGWSAVLGLVMGVADGTVSTLAFGVHWSGLLLGCALTVYAARQRERIVAALTQAREVARVTQEAILRPISRTLGGTQVCTRYHCAARESTVGGDLYDVALTPYGLRVLVGDVRGHGLDALRLTADTIAGFRELAYSTPDLTTLTRRLDARLTPELGPEDFVTAVFAEFAPGEVRLVNCGHPAPLRSGHRVELLEPLVPTPPLGLCPNPRQYRVRLQPGDRLLLYTDGLTEARDPEGTPFPFLGEAAVALHEPLPDEALHALYARLLAHTGTALADDLALVLCQPMEATVPVSVP